MSINEITDKVNVLGSAWEQFKKVNDQRLKEVEKKGNADPLFMGQLNKISDVLDSQKQRLDKIETAYNRPSREVKNQDVVANEPSEYKKAFNSYLRKGSVKELDNFEQKALSVGSNPDGGYLVSTPLSKQIVEYITDQSVMRQIASVETISSDSLDIIIDNGSAGAGWTTETTDVTETTSPQINKKTLQTFEMYAQPKATQKLVDDSAINIEAWLATKVGEVFVTNENTAFITGDGTTRPTGILTYPAGSGYGYVQQVPSGSSGVVTTDGLLELYYQLRYEYAKNATFLMNRNTVQAIRILKDTTGQYIWSPGLAAGTPDTLFGIPVKQAADMPVAAANSLSVALADFKSAYKIVDHFGIRVLRDPFTEKPFVKFYSTKRVGGDIVNFDAIKLLKLSAS